MRVDRTNGVIDWTDDLIGRLHQAWTIESKSGQQTAEALKISRYAVLAKVKRLRRAEGAERWPERGSPLRRVTDARMPPDGADALPRTPTTSWPTRRRLWRSYGEASEDEPQS